MDLKNKKAFTLAEMMIVLLVISLILAAFLPVMTKRSKSASAGGSGTDLWTHVGGASPADIYWSEGDTLGAIIGADKSNTALTARLFLNKPDTMPSHIVFQETKAGVVTDTGLIAMDGNGNVALGDVSLDSAKSNQLAIGSGAQTNKDYGIAIGYGAISTNAGDIVIGEKNLGSADLSNNVYIGYQNPSGYGSAGSVSNVAIGHNTLFQDIVHPPRLVELLMLRLVPVPRHLIRRDL